MRVLTGACVLVALLSGATLGQVAIPTEADWTDHGLVIDAGPLGGAWDAIFEGKTPCSVVKKDGVMYLYYVGADDYISQKNNIGPSHRSIGVATSTDGVNWTKYGTSPVITFSSSGNPEEGAVSGGVFLDTNGDFIAYYGANISTSPTSSLVSADTRVARSTDGLSFSGSSIVVNHADPSVYGYGDEVHGSMGYTYGGNYYAYYAPNGVPQSGRLGVSWGSSYDNLTNNAAVTSGGSTFLAGRPGSIVPIGAGTLAFFNKHGGTISVRTASGSDPIHLSTPVQTYASLPGFGQVVYLDQDRQTWFMYYNQWTHMGMLTAPAGATDTTGPAAPASAAAAATSYRQVQLTWVAADDPDTGVLHYNVYREGAKIGTTRGLSFQDDGAEELTAYNYQIRPVNLHGIEGALAAAAATTPADLTPPQVSRAAASGNPTLVTVRFDEPVDPASACDLSNFIIEEQGGGGGKTVMGASLSPDARTVMLTTDAHDPEKIYTLQVNGVRDAAAGGNVGSSTWGYTYNSVGGMVGCYPLDNTSHDGSGYAHHGQSHGSVGRISTQFGGAMLFNGANSYIEIDDTDVLDDAFANAFTVAAWVKPDDVPAYTTASNRAYAVFSSPNASIEYNTDRKFRVLLKTSSGDVAITTADIFVPGKWHHVAVAVDDDSHEMSFFIDGQLVGGAPTSLSGQVTPPGSEAEEIAWMDHYYSQYRIGVNDPLFDYESNYFKGVIDEVFLFDRALDAGEVAQVMPEPAMLAFLALSGLVLLRRRR